MIELKQDKQDLLLPVKIVPNASRDRIVGEHDGALKITVAAAPQRGAANRAVCKLLAKTLNIRTQDVTVETGQTSSRKTLRLQGVESSHPQWRVWGVALR